MSKRLTLSITICIQPHKGKFPLCGVWLSQLQDKFFYRAGYNTKLYKIHRPAPMTLQEISYPIQMQTVIAGNTAMMR